MGGGGALSIKGATRGNEVIIWNFYRYSWDADELQRKKVLGVLNSSFLRSLAQSFFRFFDEGLKKKETVV